jgi:hypothetical protein
MADQKVSDLPSLNGADVDAADLLYIVDSSAGTAGSKKITVGQYQQAAYSAGTANGVMYLNGSNVVTTGSGLVFDGTNLGIGTSSPGAKLEVASGKVLLSNTQSYAIKTAAGASNDVVSLTSGNVLVLGGGGATDSIQFWNQGLERARITSGGDLLVGTTTLSAVGNTVFGSSVPGVIHQNNNAASNGFVFTSYRRSSVEIGSVSQNGTTAVLYNTTSDRRLKDNIVPAPSASAVIDAIEIVSHDWKSAPDEHVTYGVIAQDLALVAPQAVMQGDDGDEIEKTWGVDYSKLVPMLIKEIQSLRARVAALEQA